MIPTRLDHILYLDLNDSNFLQPLEILSGQCTCDLVLKMPFVVNESLKKLKTETRERLSMLEEFLKDYDEDERAAFFDEDVFFPD